MYNSATCYILDAPFQADKEYIYLIPENIHVIPGCTVNVPYGKGNRSTLATVIRLTSLEKDISKYKKIYSIIDSVPILSDELIDLCLFLKKHTLCTFGDAVKAVIPSAARSKRSTSYSIISDTIPDGYSKLLSCFGSKKIITEAQIKKIYGTKMIKALDSLVKKGILSKSVEHKTSSAGQIEKIIFLNKQYYDWSSKRSSVQNKIIFMLKQHPFSKKELVKELGQNINSQLKSLANKGIITFSDKVTSKETNHINQLEQSDIILTEEQENALHTLIDLYKTRKPKAALLQGITGSGKTSVIMKIIDIVISDNRSAIMLVPEISLTPQMVNSFKKHYGNRLAVIHSSLSSGERLNAWKRIESGEADIVIGTRSAVFAPVKKLGIIVIDEEQEQTYKSDLAPKYQTQDVASYRCGKNNSLLLLSSATPSINSYYKALNGKYTLIKLKKRYGDAVLPKVSVVDMRKEALNGNTSSISEYLYRKIIDTREKGKQAIIFINRRGYNNSVVCRNCGSVVECPNCSVPMTYHTLKDVPNDSGPNNYLIDRYNSGILICHYCGYKQKVPLKCPSCGKEHFAFKGYGTQKVEEELKNLLPGIKILRMDTDTTSRKQSHEKILNAFKNKEADILLGTQMVAKGHNFPEVELVGVLNSDSSLFIGDYRARERTFEMLTQVIGRAGRKDDNGLAIVQTVNPSNDIILLSSSQDYERFFSKEILIRKNLTYPPFCDIVQFSLKSSDERFLQETATKVLSELKKQLLQNFKDVPVIVYGPFDEPVYKVNSAFRSMILIKCHVNSKMRDLASTILSEFGSISSKKLVISIDINPGNI